jgi:tRNA threonylcarbamoyladenosine biosynthesis protein TsaE
MPILDPHTIEFFSRSPSQTRRIGIRLGGMLQKGDVVCLRGDLGAGKTTMVQGIAQGWGSSDPVTSPTFVLVNIYRKLNSPSLYHLDAYRLQNAPEALDLDIDQMLESGALVVEWPEHIISALPKPRLWITISWIDLEQRHFVIKPEGKRFEKMMKELRKYLYGG